MVWINNGNQHLDEISNYRTILGVCLSLPILTTIIVGLRGYVRGKILRNLGADDYVIFFSAICGIIYAGLCVGQSKWGLGLPLTLRPKPNLNIYSDINFAGRPIYQVGICGFKIALCLAYLRILNTSSNFKYRILIWVVMVTCFIGHIAGAFILIFQCSPVKKSWRPLTKGTCLPNDSTFYGLAAVTIFYDLVIFFLPIPMLISLNISLRKRVVLIVVFMLGLLTTVCSVLRLVQISIIAKNGNSTMLVLWGVIELNIGITLTCIPTLGPLIPYFRNSTTNGTHSRKNTYQLSSVDRARNNIRSSHITTSVTTGPPGTPFDKYGGGFGPEFRSMSAKNLVSDSSSDEDRVRLKDATMADSTAFGVAEPRGAQSGNAGGGGGNIMKTTHIRVSDDDENLHAEKNDPGAFTKVW